MGWQGGLPRERLRGLQGKYTCGGHPEGGPCTWRYLANAQAIDTGVNISSTGGTQSLRRKLT